MVFFSKPKSAGRLVIHAVKDDFFFFADNGYSLESRRLVGMASGGALNDEDSNMDDCDASSALFAPLCSFSGFINIFVSTCS